MQDQLARLLLERGISAHLLGVADLMEVQVDVTESDSPTVLSVSMMSVLIMCECGGTSTVTDLVMN